MSPLAGQDHLAKAQMLASIELRKPTKSHGDMVLDEEPFYGVLRR